jgi:hypothetical protein
LPSLNHFTYFKLKEKIMALLRTLVAQRIKAVSFGGNVDLYPVRIEHDFTAAITTADVLELCTVPPGMEVLDWTIDSDDLDTGAGLAFSVGVLNATKTAMLSPAGTYVTAATIAQTGGLLRAGSTNHIRFGATQTDRVIGLIPTVNAAGFTNGRIGLTLFCRNV